MSASISPTRWPSLLSAIARFTATVVFPTPPLPDPTATIFETPGNATGDGMTWECAIIFYSISCNLVRTTLIKRAPDLLRLTANLNLLSIKFYRSSASGFRRVESWLGFHTHHSRQNRMHLSHAFGQRPGAGLQNRSRRQFVHMAISNRGRRCPSRARANRLFVHFHPAPRSEDHLGIAPGNFR